MPKHVLLVIPDEDAAAIYESYLTVVDRLLVQSVRKSFKAVDRSLGAEPDLIVTEYLMYVDRNRSLVRALRDVGVETPIIAVSADVMPEVIAQAYEDGVTLFLRMPLSPVELSDAVRR